MLKVDESVAVEPKKGCEIRSILMDNDSNIMRLSVKFHDPELWMKAKRGLVNVIVVESDETEEPKEAS